MSISACGLDPGVVLRHRRAASSPSGASPRIRSRLRACARGDFGRNCSDDAAGAPAAARRPRRRDEFLGDREADAGRDLLRVAEIGVRRRFEVSALERARSPGSGCMSAPCSMVMARCRGRAASPASARRPRSPPPPRPRRSARRRGSGRACGSRRRACAPARRSASAG